MDKSCVKISLTVKSTLIEKGISLAGLHSAIVNKISGLNSVVENAEFNVHLVTRECIEVLVKLTYFSDYIEPVLIDIIKEVLSELVRNKYDKIQQMAYGGIFDVYAAKQLEDEDVDIFFQDKTIEEAVREPMTSYTQKEAIKEALKESQKEEYKEQEYIQMDLDFDLDGIFDDIDEITEEKIQGKGNVNEAATDKRGLGYEEELNERLEALIGLEEFKEEMRAVAKYARENINVTNNPEKERFFPLHYIFTIEPGMGLTSILKFMSTHFNQLGIIKNKGLMEYEGSLSFDSKSDSGNPDGVFLKSEGGIIRVDSDYGIIAINLINQLEDQAFNFSKLMDLAFKERGKTVFVFVINESSYDTSAIIERIQGRVNCHHINFPRYTTDQFMDIGRRLLGSFGIILEEPSQNLLRSRIEKERQSADFQNIRSLIRLIEDIRMRRMFNNQNQNYWQDRAKEGVQDPGKGESNAKGTVGKAGAVEFMTEENRDKYDVWRELDEIVGLEGIKHKIKEIVANAKVQKLLSDKGIRKKNMCYHMVFMGNPGTGKTTMARMIGKLFKEIGVLKIGDTYEVGREGLVGRYVGQTAPKVREKIQEAIGSVLFIDEAYSLYTEGEKVDFGHEAIETLTKLMEDRRHDLIVIMAGYTNEMKKLLDMNPGLKERIPHRIEFPNYSPKELTDIFIRELGKEFRLGEGVREAIMEIFEKAVKNAGDHFANGRLARNIAERLEVKHSMRICSENSVDLDSLLTITLEDIRALYEDEDLMQSILGKDNGPSKIGFLA